MKIRTAIALFAGFFNAGWLCWVFVMLYLKGAVVIPEPSRLIAALEIVLTLTTAALFIERLWNLHERRRKPMVKIPMKTVAGSSNIAAFGYDPNTRELAIQFNSGRTYVYNEVEPEVWDELQKAESKGHYFAAWIKGSYEYRREEE